MEEKDNKSLNYCGLTISVRVRDGSKDPYAYAFCPLCGKEEQSTVLKGQVGYAVKGTQGKIILHLRMAHKVSDDKEAKDE
jgi:hypothetical protein